jgi:DNA gyrase subunit A
MQAKAHFEEMSRGRSRIVVTELPYQANKVALIERIASVVRDGKLEGLTDLRDESDRAGMRLVIELTRNVDPKAVLADLFKQTPLQQTFGLQALALVDGEPRTLSLKRMLQLFIHHRQEIIRRRSEYDLKRARERAHILEGLLRALDILDQVIDTIRRSQSAETARNNLVSNFKFSEIQAQAILDMQLRRLAALERRKLQEEHKELLKQIAYLEDLLAHPAKILQVIKADLLAIKEKYGDARRTQIVDRTKGTLTTTDLLPDQQVWVTVSANGDLRRQDTTRVSANALRQVGKGSEVALLTANTRDYLYLFAKDGRCRRVSVHEIPQSGEEKHLAEMTEFSRRDTITAALTLPRNGSSEGYLFMATEQGMVKRVTMADFMAASASAELSVMNVEEKDKLAWVMTTSGEQEIILVSSEGQSIRFSEEDVRSMGLAAGGIGGMKLKKGFSVIYAAPVDPQGELLTVTAQGYAKRTHLSEYSRQGRNGGGIVTHKTTSRTGNVTTALLIDAAPPEAVIILARKGGPRSVAIEEIPTMGRGVQGKQVVEIGDGNAVVAVRSVSSAYEVAVENRVVVEEEVEAVTTGPVKKANPFADKGKSPAKGSSTANNNSGTPPSDQSKAAVKPSKAEATPKPTATISVKHDKATPPDSLSNSPSGKVEAAKAIPATTTATNGSSEHSSNGKIAVKPSKATGTPSESPAPRKSAAKPERAPTAKDRVQDAVKDTVKEKPSAVPALSPSKPASDKPVKIKSESAPRQTPKLEVEVAQPQQASLLPDADATRAAATPRRNQKLAAVTSVKRPKK